MFDTGQFRKFVLKPILNEVGLWSKSAENLLVGTALVESDCYYFKQLEGPALGVFQIEPKTYHDIVSRIPSQFKDKILNVLGYKEFPNEERLKSDLGLSLCIARLKYYLDPSPLPHQNKIDLLANYWGKIYNTLNKSEDKIRFIKLYKLYGEHTSNQL